MYWSILPKLVISHKNNKGQELEEVDLPWFFYWWSYDSIGNMEHQVASANTRKRDKRSQKPKAKWGKKCQREGIDHTIPKYVY